MHRSPVHVPGAVRRTSTAMRRLRDGALLRENPRAARTSALPTCPPSRRANPSSPSAATICFPLPAVPRTELPPQTAPPPLPPPPPRPPPPPPPQPGACWGGVSRGGGPPPPPFPPPGPPPTGRKH